MSDAECKRETFKEECFTIRNDIEDQKQAVAFLMRHPELANRESDKSDPLDGTGEMHANLKLAYRHLEDARMRLGKAVQAADGGTSCYPR